MIADLSNSYQNNLYVTILAGLGLSVICIAVFVYDKHELLAKGWRGMGFVYNCSSSGEFVLRFVFLEC